MPSMGMSSSPMSRSARRTAGAVAGSLTGTQAFGRIPTRTRTNQRNQLCNGCATDSSLWDGRSTVALTGHFIGLLDRRHWQYVHHAPCGNTGMLAAI